MSQELTPKELVAKELENERLLMLDEAIYGQRLTDENGMRIDPTTVVIKTNKRTGKRTMKIIK